MEGMLSMYYEDFEKYKKIYGDDMVVLLENGTFYEVNSKSFGYMKKLTSLLNILLTKKNKNDENSDFMCGFQSTYVDKYLKILVDNNYTVILKKQFKENGKIIRKIHKIVTKSTYSSNDYQKFNSNNLMVMYIHTKINDIFLYIAFVDIITNTTVYYSQISSTQNFIILEHMNNILLKTTPTELIIYKQKNNDITYFVNNMSASENTNSTIKEIDKSVFDTNVQNIFFEKVYKNYKDNKDIMIQQTNYISDDTILNGVILLLLKYVHEHDDLLLKNIKYPVKYDNNNITFSSNTLTQLNVISDKRSDKSLFDILNNTSTTMGMRFLYHRLTNPLTLHTEINTIYDHVDCMIADNFYNRIEKSLTEIFDIDRLYKKIITRDIYGSQLVNLTTSIQECINVYNYVSDHFENYEIDKRFINECNNDVITNLKNFVDDIEKTFIIAELRKCNNFIMSFIFNTGIYSTIDNLLKTVENNFNIITLLANELEKYITDKKKVSSKITIKKSDKNSYYLTLSKTRAEILKNNISSIESINIEGKKIYTNDFVFEFTKTSAKIFIDINKYEKNKKKIDTINNIEEKDYDMTMDDDDLTNEQKILLLTQKYYDEKITQYSNKYGIYFEQISKFIAYVDFIKSNAKSAVIYNYVRPTIKFNKTKTSFVAANSLRHPIIERIIDYEYTPHNVNLGNSVNGMLLYGLNSSGKCFDGNTKLIMYDGTIKYAKDIVSNDKLLGDDGTVRNVLSTTTGYGKMYSIKSTDNFFTEIKVNGQHILCLVDRRNKIYECTVEDFINKVNNKYDYLLYGNGIYEHEQNNETYTYDDNKNTSENMEYICNNITKFMYNERRDIIIKILTRENNVIFLDNGIYSDIINLNFNKNDIDNLIFIVRSCGWKIKIVNNYVEIIFDSTYDFIIEENNNDLYYGFETDGNKRFMIDSFIITHNSSLMKSVGLAIIMSQAGCFVPATKFIYTPYNSLYTRIISGDNIYRGLSTFTVELLELQTILKKSDKNTLVIGDEICSSTEHISAISIVSSTILKLAKLNSSFIFATHLHEICSLEKIKELNNVKAFHLEVEYDSKTNTLIYGRTLKETSGESLYGIIVARYIIQDDEFIKTANSIKNELLQIHDSLLPDVYSRYNTKLPLIECFICKKPNKKSHISEIETHHIHQQSNFKNGEYLDDKKHVKKNGLSNLVSLCTQCHDDLHNKKFFINGYVMTSNGRGLSVSYDGINNEIIY